MKRLHAFALTVMALPLAGLSVEASAADCPKGKIKIYTSWPLQGAMIPEGTGMKNGVNLAMDQNKSEAAGFCLELVNLDDASPQTGKWDGAVEAENANKAVADPDAMVYIGTYNSGAAKVSMAITQRAHMAQVTPANTYPGLTKKAGAAPGEPEIYRPLGIVSYFRVPPADDIQGAVGASFAKKLGYKKVYILNDQELYGKGIADVFEAEAKKIGLQVLGNEGIDYKQPDQKPILTKIRASGADLVYMGAVVETGAQTVIRQMKDLGMVAPKVSFMGPDGLFEEELLKAATCDAAMGVNMHITFASLPFEHMTGKGGEIYKLYKERYKIEPTSYALYSWEAAEIAIEGIKRAGVKDREKIRAAIAATKDFNGLNGKWSFDENGDTTMKVMSGLKVVKADGAPGCKFEFQETLK
ncbi:amino acid/amide ABC transporter substrate-binding protein, HAAT family [Rhizobiales bacterium GAS191]|nr:amino acid/amide ABC transporter substrate-binding protein, HAAT family [Rhizobiales bacterium GAS188]SEF09542.1 amino acid/amide ABC transporter substrate-binding protein, HAAT family [Rhizobiales bacterium GAS191]